MKTLEQIKDEVAEEHVSSSWNDMMFRYGGVGDVIIDKVAKRYAREVAQSTLEKAAENSILKLTFSSGEIATNPTWKMPDGELIELQKSSITNPNNITLL
ncbi:hypothetical protein OZ664_11825 [Elizabethkingia sp. HX WHF]|uniref:hypothetical protein n=1 Tax=Elizabethkingia sp. HX WHF TaxID=3003190 RepID=UPI002A2435B6|nr:hypothetical protein [Elizabethkingia sp. HX WHF]MDX8564689.1 hypothetical protein [Elizabethkingia sp. HX WHF]